MPGKPKPRRDRYDVSGNVETEYVDAERTVLLNKRGITDLHELQCAEEQALAAAYQVLLGEVRTDTPITCDLLCHVHSRIFGRLYAWAGRWRTVWISKPGITWPAPDFLAANMLTFERDVLAKYPATALGDDELFCNALAEIQGEFLVVHPFREGNARTIKLATNLLAVQTDRPLLVYDSSEDGKQRYIAAASAAFKKDYRPMTAIVRCALGTAREAP
jgi:cell filamentation protein